MAPDFSLQPVLATEERGKALLSREAVSAKTGLSAPGTLPSPMASIWSPQDAEGKLFFMIYPAIR